MRRLLLLASVLCLACAGGPPERDAVSLQDGRYVMGTVLELTLVGTDTGALARARDRAFAVAERLDGLMSRYVASSDVSRLNAAAGGEPVPIDAEVATLLARALDFRERTRGSFDVTIGPLVSLWIDAARTDRLPGVDAIDRARARVGARHVRLGDDRAALASGSILDLGGLAKGFALDRMLPELREEGIDSALLSFGQSSVWAMGAPPDGPGWRLLARSPEGGFAGIVTLRDLALSVSGSLGQWSEIEGRRFGHVVDPRSGWPLTKRRQALVVGPDGALTEALSTALLILGAPEGLEVVAAQPGCEALLLEPGGLRFATAGFEALTAFELLPESAGSQDAVAAVRTVEHAAGAQLPGL